MANTKPCYDCGDMLERAYTETRDAIRKFILENGTELENGTTFLSLGGARYPPAVLTYIERCKKPDFWEENDCLALAVNEYGEVWFYVNEGVKEVSADDAFIRNDDGELEFDYNYWYCLDWDYGNSYQHNVERIAYYIGNHWEEDHEEE